MPVPPGHIGWTWASFPGSNTIVSVSYTLQRALTITQADWYAMMTDRPGGIPWNGMDGSTYSNGVGVFTQWAFDSNGVLTPLFPAATAAYAAGDVLRVDGFTTAATPNPVSVWLGVIDVLPVAAQAQGVVIG